MLLIAKMLRGVFGESTRVQQNVYDICRIGTHRETPCMYVSSTFYRDKNTSQGFVPHPPVSECSQGKATTSEDKNGQKCESVDN